MPMRNLHWNTKHRCSPCQQHVWALEICIAAINVVGGTPKTGQISSTQQAQNSPKCTILLLCKYARPLATSTARTK